MAEITQEKSASFFTNDSESAYGGPKADGVTTTTGAVLGDVQEEDEFEYDPFAAGRAKHMDDGDFLDFRSMGWFRAGLIATAENIALGILSFPSVYMRLGLFGGIFCTIALGLIAYATAWIMVDFKCRHMGVMNFGDAGGVVFGKWGQRIFGWGMVLKAMGLAGSHVLAGQVGFTDMTSHITCNVWWGFMIMVVSIGMSWSREWHKLWWLCFVSLSCIAVASMINMVSVGVQDSSILTKGGAPIKVEAFAKHTNLMDVIGAITNIVFGYGGNMACFSFCSEMKNPRDFKKSFAMSQTIVCISYIVVGTVIYCFGGQYTTSPALSMCGRVAGIVAYAICMVTILVSGVLGANVGVKYIYVESLRTSPLLTSKSMKAQMIWMGMVTGVWIVAFILASVIPFFNALLTIVSSLFSVWFVCGGAGFLWLYDNTTWFGKQKNKIDLDDSEERGINTTNKKIWLVFCLFVIAISCAITPLGLYSAIQTIIDGYRGGKFKHPFAC